MSGDAGPAPLRVVVDGAVLSRPATGTARWVRGLAGALAGVADLDVTLARGPAHLRRGGRLHRVPNFLRERWWYEVQLPHLARRERADVILLPANLTARRGRVPQVVTILDVNFLTEPGTYERTFVHYASWAYRRAVRDAARITTISEFSRAEIARHLDVDPRRLEVVYPGLDEPSRPLAADTPHPRPYALFVGATERHKNVGLLLDAWRERSPGGLDLAIVGQPGRDHSMVVRAAATIGGRVVVRGRVDRDELEAWYGNASVFVYPSRVEGFGFPPLEAMQRGVPVISSTAGSLPEVLGDAAVYFDPDDRSSLMSHVDEIMAESDKRDALRRKGLETAARYSWSHTAESMASVLRGAIADPTLGQAG